MSEGGKVEGGGGGGREREREREVVSAVIILHYKIK